MDSKNDGQIQKKNKKFDINILLGYPEINVERIF